MPFVRALWTLALPVCLALLLAAASPALAKRPGPNPGPSPGPSPAPPSPSSYSFAFGDVDQVFVVVQEAPLATAGNPAGNLAGRRLTQQQVEAMSFSQQLANGKRMYTTPFILADGYGDGPPDPSEDYREEGGRAGLQKAAPVVRANGLDAQACVECHAIMRNSTIPFTPGIGGASGVSGTVLFKPAYVDLASFSPATMDGRLINPVNNAGLGGIELLAKEMTADLQELKAEALANPGRVVRLQTHDVDFGVLVSDGALLDTSGVLGVDPDLVVRPFGRKGEFATVREFDIGALSFHFGMQAAEQFGEGQDADGDGVRDEILAGEVSVLHLFLTNLPRPLVDRRADQRRLSRGLDIFRQTGCDTCHKPMLFTRMRTLTYSYPELDAEPYANIYMTSDLTITAGFTPSGRGMMVPLFADLKRHDMGEGLAESLDLPGLSDPAAFNRRFRTPPLWAVADTAPYLHDGRAQTIPDAILAHGGEAQDARDAFAGLSSRDQDQLVYLLSNLHNPLIR